MRDRDAIAVLDLDLARPRPRRLRAGRCAKARILVRWRDVPVADVTVPVRDGVVVADALRRALEPSTWHLAAARARELLDGGTAIDDCSVERLFDASVPAPAPAPRPWPLVTVAVCTRDRADDLRRCLQALARLDYPHLDVLVVDNASRTDAVARLVEREFPQVRCVREDRPGLDWARNRAIAEARGEIVAFTDDDVEPDRGWVRALARVFVEAPEVAAVAGLVAPAELETEAQRLFERYGGFARGLVRRWHRRPLPADGRPFHHGAGQYGTGANMAFRRDLFARIGAFDPALDVGTVTNGGGDLEIFFRVLQAGETLVYEPAAVVRHRHRRSMAELRRQIGDWGTGFVAYAHRSVARFPGERLPFARLLKWWATHYVARRLVRSVLRRDAIPTTLVLREVLGAAKGVRRWPRAHRRAEELRAASFEPVPSFPPLDVVPPAPVAPATLDPRAIGVRSVALDGSIPDGLRDVSRFAHVAVYPTIAGAPVGCGWIANHGHPVSRAQLLDVLAHVAAEAALRAPGAGARLIGRLLQGGPLLPGAPAKGRARAASPTDATLAPPPTLTTPHARRTVSIVVATADRPDALRDCLASLVAQRTMHDVELLVVDNRPGSGCTAPVVADFPQARLVEEPRAGLSYARNAGILEARGEIVVCTDDDVVAPPQWLDALVAPFDEDDVMIVTGNVLPRSLETRAQQLFERYGGLGRGFVRRSYDRRWMDTVRGRGVPTWEIGATANAAFRASVFAEDGVGLLDEALGAGTPTGCSEDTDLFYRVLRAGGRLVYEPRAAVWHDHRRDFASLRRQILAYSKGHVAYHLATLFRDGDRRAIPHLLWVLPRWHAKQTVRWLRGRRDYPLLLVGAEIVGNLLGPLALLRSRRRVARLGRSREDSLAVRAGSRRDARRALEDPSREEMPRLARERVTRAAEPV